MRNPENINIYKYGDIMILFLAGILLIGVCLCKCFPLCNLIYFINKNIYISIRILKKSVVEKLTRIEEINILKQIVEKMKPTDINSSFTYE